MIRIALESDLERMLQIYSPYVENTTASFEYVPPSAEAFATRFRHITERFPWIVWEEDGLVLGYAYASAPFERAAYSWCCEPSIYLAPEAHRRGIGRKLYAALEEVLRRQGFRVSYAVVTGENQASIDFHEAVGYKFLAEFPKCGFKAGRWLSIVWLEKDLNSVEISSKMPLPWMAIVKDNKKLCDILADLSLS